MEVVELKNGFFVVRRRRPFFFWEYQYLTDQSSYYYPAWYTNPKDVHRFCTFTNKERAEDAIKKYRAIRKIELK